MKYVIFLMLATTTASFAQKEKFAYYLYNKDWKAVRDISSAYFVVQSTSIGDSLFVNRIFKGKGHLWRQESYRDAGETIPHGQFAWYDDEGRIDSSGFVNYRKKTGTWSYYNDTLGTYLTITYEDGKEIERRDYVTKIIKTPRGDKTFDEEKKERDTLSQSGKTKGDQKEAAFEGGMSAYKTYLENNVVAPDDLVKTGFVKLQFFINTSGKIESVLILRSLQLTADIEAIRVLSEMPDWTPAHQNGKNVKYQAIQYITFKRG